MVSLVRDRGGRRGPRDTWHIKGPVCLSPPPRPSQGDVRAVTRSPPPLRSGLSPAAEAERVAARPGPARPFRLFLRPLIPGLAPRRHRNGLWPPSQGLSENEPLLPLSLPPVRPPSRGPPLTRRPGRPIGKLPRGLPACLPAHSPAIPALTVDRRPAGARSLPPACLRGARSPPPSRRPPLSEQQQQQPAAAAAGAGAGAPPLQRLWLWLSFCRARCL